MKLIIEDEGISLLENKGQYPLFGKYRARY